MNARNHKRSQSNGLKGQSANSRPSRPSLASKRTGSSHNTATQRSTSGIRGAKKSFTEVRYSEAEDEDMAASFLQFCATCERQIVTPTSSILYCSEHCRRKDVTKSSTPPISPTMTAYNDHHIHHTHLDILPQRSPTVLRPLSSNFSELSLCDHHNLDFTLNHQQSDTDETQTDEETYSTSATEPHVLDLPGYPTATLAPSTRGSTSTDPIPSLVHSPSSSYGTLSSFTRPTMAPRTSTTSTRSVDLVTPVTLLNPPSPLLAASGAETVTPSSLKSSASTLTTLRVAESDMSDDGGEAKDARRDSAQGDGRGAVTVAGCLRQLFNHDAIRSASRRRSRA